MTTPSPPAPTATPPAPEALIRWLAARGWPGAGATPLAADGSARSYLRVRLPDGSSHVACWYPPAAREVADRFLRTGALLAAHGVAVPEVLATDPDEGWMLLSDAGAKTLFDLVGRPWAELAPRFTEAVEVAGRIAALDGACLAGLSPPLDGALLWRELEQSWELFLVPEGLVGPPSLAARFREGLAELCRNLGAAPLVPCHRDFMARNLVPTRGGLVVLDHQDLRLGPPLYDLASLFNDSLFPPAGVSAPLLGSRVDSAAYRRAVVQRTLKAIGSFAAFRRRGITRHQALIAPTLARAWQHLPDVPELSSLTPELAPRWRRFLVDAGVGLLH